MSNLFIAPFKIFANRNQLILSNVLHYKLYKLEDCFFFTTSFCLLVLKQVPKKTSQVWINLTSKKLFYMQLNVYGICDFI